LVGVDLADRRGDVCEMPRERLDDEDELGILADLSLPAVDRSDGRNHVDAGSMPAFDERLADIEPLLFRADRSQHHDDVVSAHRRTVEEAPVGVKVAERSPDHRSRDGRGWFPNMRRQNRSSVSHAGNAGAYGPRLPIGYAAVCASSRESSPPE